MRYTYQIKTGEFEFINGELEGTAQEAVDAYHGLKLAFGGGQGLTEKELDAFLEEYLGSGEVQNGTEIYAAMSNEQKAWTQRVKRAIKRIQAKAK